MRIAASAAAMSLAVRLARSLLRSPARPGPAQRGLISGPPQEPLGPGESVVGFIAMFAVCLGPAAWVLAHLEDYKKGE
ncbi:cytochrome c oxidase subunit 8B, mitochondrial [Grus americana]|uniref:Cytochrome c oxidase subunit 8A, mitochondrial n=1 Tax=Grus japonensis TaxID=30415 RepID=A0ABC9XXI8_GRUJA|nr:cytochrome c oxidase subunit 8B, mitochondrial [Grus americana]